MIFFDDWLRDVSRVSGIAPAKLLGTTRFLPEVRLRQAMMFVLRRKTPLSNKQIALRLGKLDHSTVIHAVEVMGRKLRQRDERTLRAYRIAIRAYVSLQQKERLALRSIKGAVDATENHNRVRRSRRDECRDYAERSFEGFRAAA